MKHHRPVVHVTPTGTIRQCSDCLQSWELLRGKEHSIWVPIAEGYDDGSPAKQFGNPMECQGEARTTQERSEKATSVGSSGGTTRGANLCYCKQCNGKSPHYSGAKFCYCNRCDGKRQHNG